MTPSTVRVMWMREVSWVKRQTYSQVSQPMHML